MQLFPRVAGVAALLYLPSGAEVVPLALPCSRAPPSSCSEDVVLLGIHSSSVDSFEHLQAHKKTWPSSPLPSSSTPVCCGAYTSLSPGGDVLPPPEASNSSPVQRGGILGGEEDEVSVAPPLQVRLLGVHLSPTDSTSFFESSDGERGAVRLGVMGPEDVQRQAPRVGDEAGRKQDPPAPPLLGDVVLVMPSNGDLYLNGQVRLELSEEAVGKGLLACLSANEKTVPLSVKTDGTKSQIFDFCFTYDGPFSFETPLFGTLALKLALYQADDPHHPVKSFNAVVDMQPRSFTTPLTNLSEIASSLDAEARRDASLISSFLSIASESSRSSVVLFFLSFERHSQNTIFQNLACSLPRELFQVHALGFATATGEPEPILDALKSAHVSVTTVMTPPNPFEGGGRGRALQEELQTALWLNQLSDKTIEFLQPILQVLEGADVLLLANSHDDYRLSLFFEVCRLVENSRGKTIIRVMDLPNISIAFGTDVDAFVAPSYFVKSLRMRIDEANGADRKAIKVIYPAAIEPRHVINAAAPGLTSCCGEGNRPPRKEGQRRVFRVGYLGRLALDRHPALFFLMARLVLDEIEQDIDGNSLVDIKFVVAGDGVLAEGLAALANELGLADCVEFLGTLNGKEAVAEYLSSLSVIVNTAIVETFGISNVEAGLGLVPIVAFDGGGNSESVLIEGEEDDGSILVNPRDNYRGLARGVLAVFRRDEALERGRYCCSEKGQTNRQLISERFGMKRFVNGYAAFFVNLIEESKAKILM